MADRMYRDTDGAGFWSSVIIKRAWTYQADCPYMDDCSVDHSDKLLFLSCGRWIFNSSYGILNELLQKIGVISEGINFFKRTGGNVDIDCDQCVALVPIYNNYYFVRTCYNLRDFI